MEIWITTNQIKDVLKEVKNQFVSLALNVEAGVSSALYFDIDDIIDMKTGDGDMTILIMRSDRDSRCYVVDVRLISRMIFNKYLVYKSLLAEEIRVGKANRVLEVTYSSNMLSDKSKGIVLMPSYVPFF